MPIQEDHLYTFDYTDRFAFADLSDEELVSIFLDGRSASEFLSYQLTHEFPGLEYVDYKWFDFSHPDFPQIEQKQITRKSGFRFAKSSMKGHGRQIDRELIEDYIHDHNLYYLIVSTLSFPIVHLKLVSGHDVMRSFPQQCCETTAKNACSKLGIPFEVDHAR